MLKALLGCTMAALLSLASPVVNWGLGNFGNEIVPKAPAGAQQMLIKYGGLYHLNTDEKKVLFTFDLGYEAGYTAEVLDILKANNIEAIFFICGHYLKETELINRMIAEGHSVGNHTYHHKDLPRLSDEGIKEDIGSLQKSFIEKYPTAQSPVYLRPPKGRFDERTLYIAKGYNLKPMMWSLAIQDWGKKPFDAERGAKKMADRIHPGAIILSHITNAGTPKMLKLLLPLLAAKGYVTATPNDIGN